jgi:hypothetical protein
LSLDGWKSHFFPVKTLLEMIHFPWFFEFERIHLLYLYVCQFANCQRGKNLTENKLRCTEN